LNVRPYDVVFGDVLATCELVNCVSMQVQCTGVGGRSAYIIPHPCLVIHHVVDPRLLS